VSGNVPDGIVTRAAFGKVGNQGVPVVVPPPGRFRLLLRVVPGSLPALRSDVRTMDENRITIEPGKRSGQPCIRGMRITVWDVLGWLAAGMSEEQIVSDYPELEREDFRAVYDYAARVGRRVAL
jgi:uncharacterized protein (DUF433 family)